MPRKGWIFLLHTPKGIQQKAEITRGTIYDAITNIKVSKNFKEDCIYTWKNHNRKWPWRGFLCTMRCVSWKIPLASFAKSTPKMILINPFYPVIQSNILITQKTSQSSFFYWLWCIMLIQCSSVERIPNGLLDRVNANSTYVWRCVDLCLKIRQHAPVFSVQ